MNLVGLGEFVTECESESRRFTFFKLCFRGKDSLDLRHFGFAFGSSPISGSVVFG